MHYYCRSGKTTHFFVFTQPRPQLLGIAATVSMQLKAAHATHAKLHTNKCNMYHMTGRSLVYKAKDCCEIYIS